MLDFISGHCKLIVVHLNNEIIDDITVELNIKLESYRPQWLYWSLLIQMNDAPPSFRRNSSVF